MHQSMHIRDGAQSYKSTYRPHLTCLIRCPDLPMSKLFCPWDFLIAGGGAVFHQMYHSSKFCSHTFSSMQSFWISTSFYHLHISTLRLLYSNLFKIILSSGNDNSLQYLWFYHWITLTLVTIGLLFSVRLQETSLLKNHLISLLK